MYKIKYHSGLKKRRLSEAALRVFFMQECEFGHLAKTMSPFTLLTCYWIAKPVLLTYTAGHNITLFGRATRGNEVLERTFDPVPRISTSNYRPCSRGSQYHRRIQRSRASALARSLWHCLGEVQIRDRLNSLLSTRSSSFQVIYLFKRFK